MTISRSTRQRAVLVTVLMAALAVAYIRAQQFGKEPANLRVLKVAADLFVLNNDVAPGNSTVFVTNAGVMLGR